MFDSFIFLSFFAHNAAVEPRASQAVWQARFMLGIQLRSAVARPAVSGEPHRRKSPAAKSRATKERRFLPSECICLVRRRFMYLHSIQASLFVLLPAR
jgi:hypothetical protein